MFTLSDTNGPLGAKVTGIDIQKLSSDDLKELHSTWLTYRVLQIKNVKLSEEELVGLSRHFGALEFAPRGLISAEERSRLKNPYVATISNIVEDGKPIGGLSNAETSWHTDMSYIEEPPTASLLHAIEVPSEGGDTAYTCMEGALHALPRDLRARVDYIQIKHDSAHDSTGKLRPGHAPFDDPMDAPGEYHPAVVRNPDTNKEVLFLGRRENASVKGLGPEESEALLDEIWEYAILPEHRWTVNWEVGDLVIWDNRSVMHMRYGFSNLERRHMIRTQVHGPAIEEIQKPAVKSNELDDSPSLFDD